MRIALSTSITILDSLRLEVFKFDVSLKQHGGSIGVVAAVGSVLRFSLISEAHCRFRSFNITTKEHTSRDKVKETLCRIIYEDIRQPAGVFTRPGSY